MTTEELQKNVEEQTKLSQETALLESKISSLESHLHSLQTQVKTAEADVQAATPEEIIKQAQEAAKRQQEALTRQTEAASIECSLNSFRSQLAEKQETLQIAKRTSEFERLRDKAIEFNTLIDEVVARLDEMKEIDRAIGSRDYTPLTITAEIRELPYCAIHPANVKVRRRVDILRNS